MEELVKALEDNEYSGEEKLEEAKIEVENLTFIKLRDTLYTIGNIINEDLLNKIYVAEIRTSKIGNTAVVAMKLDGHNLHLCGYCTQGLIKQNTVQKVFTLIEESVSTTGKTKKKSKKVILSFVFGIAAVLLGIYIFNVLGIINATNEYNNEAEKYNTTVEEYNNLTEKGIYENINDMPEKMEKLDIQGTDFFSATGVIFSSNSKDKIVKDTATITDMLQDNKNVIAVAKQVIKPSMEFVSNRIKNIEMITGIETVSDKNNPDGLLNKDGGYYGCVYFTIDLIDSDKVDGNSIVDKGTDAGGAVELYDSVDKAKNRCEYLASFDGTVITSGSYVIVGTMVIRTSYKLDDYEQYQLTNTIIENLTEIQDKK